MKLIEPEKFRKMAQKYKVEEIWNCKIKLENGKSFSKTIFKQNKVEAQPACGKQVY